MNRRAYIDWLRGLAVVIMIEAHTIDAWTLDEKAVRSLAQYQWLTFLAGWAAPLFLWLAGVSVTLAMASHLRKGKSQAEASWLVQKRGWEVFAMAFLFRFQSYVLSPTSPWWSMLKVDILNIMGLAMVGAAWCSAKGKTAREQSMWLLGPTAVILLIGQFTAGWSWPSELGGFEGYIRTIGKTGNFMLFPWAGFVFLGAWIGRLLLVNRDAAADRQFHLRLFGAGAALALGAFGGSHLPALTPHSIFWYTSTSWFLMRFGVMMMLLALAWLWMKRPTANHWSPMLVFGQTSLFVYWVHVEIVYGFPSIVLRHTLSIREAFVAYGLFTLLMLALAILWQRREKGPLLPAALRVQ